MPDHPVVKVLSGPSAVLGDSREGSKDGADQLLGLLRLTFGLFLHQFQHLTDLFVATHLHKQPLNGMIGVVPGHMTRS